LKSFLKKFLENLSHSKFYRNSLPRGVDLFYDIKRIYPYKLKEIWDIGAHKGETTLHFRSQIPSAIIRSFEPVSENFEILSENCSKLQNQFCYKLAMGDKSKNLALFLQEGSVIHSLREDLNKPASEHGISELIQQETVDSQFLRFQSKFIDLLKIDVEGYELQVLQGSTECLQNKKIQFIYLETGLDDRFNSLQEIIAKLAPFGYLPYGIYEQTPYWTGKQNLWYWNTLFANEEIL
jgi:FkbM family methyltransferase